MVNSASNSNTSSYEQQHNNTRSVLLYDPEERIKNADRLAKSLKTYLNTSPIKKKRGFQKDARISQLNAAYKYIIHLEDKLTTICNTHNQLTPDDCKLVHNTNANFSYRNRLQNSDMTPNTPSQRNLIHESSTLSGNAASSSPKISLDSKKTPMCSSSSTANMMPLKNLMNFENIDASPILGNENHFFEEIENFSEFESNIKSSARKNFKSPQVNSRKRKLNDLNTPVAVVDLNNNSNDQNSKPCSSKSLKMPVNGNIGCQNLEDESVARKHYFLRSTNRLKNMLLANNPVSQQQQQSQQEKTTLIANKKSRQSSNKKNQYNRVFDSSMGSTRSTSVATTPSVPNSNMSSSSSNEFDQHLNTIETKHLIELNLSQDQVAQLYESNLKENSNLKKTFSFV